MTINTLVVWLIVGAIAGILADMVVGDVGLSLIESIVVGIVGAFIGGWVFDQLHIVIGGGIWGTIFIAFVGAVILLLLLGAARRGRYSSRRP